jgi:hypothetical protein
MRSEDHPQSRPEIDERAAEQARLTVERAERAWERQVESESAAGTMPGSRLLRIVLLGFAIAAIVFLLFQRLAQIG